MSRPPAEVDFSLILATDRTDRVAGAVAHAFPPRRLCGPHFRAACLQHSARPWGLSGFCLVSASEVGAFASAFVDRIRALSESDSRREYGDAFRSNKGKLSGIWRVEGRARTISVAQEENEQDCNCHSPGGGKAGDCSCLATRVQQAASIAYRARSALRHVSALCKSSERE